MSNPMTPIEAAAREICDNYDLHACKSVDFDPVKDIAAIINRHLFPVVRPEDVVYGESYWFRTGSKWECGQAYNDLARRRRIVDECDEIRGPIPMPEVTK